MQYINQVIESLELSKLNTVPVIDTLSKKTKQRPEYVSFFLLTILITFFVFFSLGHTLLMILINFLYPTYKSFKALESRDQSDNKRWLVYWTVFGFVFAFKNFFGFFLSLLPGSTLFLTLVLFAVYCPLTNGYEYIYVHALRPLLKTYESKIDKYLEMARDEAKEKVRRGVTGPDGSWGK